MSAVQASELDVFACPLNGTRLIEASAGTGKTWAISGLYLRLLLESGLPVEQILVVTFTNAATAELRERIRSRLVETLAALRGAGAGGIDPFVPSLLTRLRAQASTDDATLSSRIETALQAFDEAAIHTIHGFCQRALADTPFSSGMPMRQDLLTDDAALRDQVVADFWRRRVAHESLPRPLADWLVQRGDSPTGWSQLLRQRLARPLARTLWPDDDGGAEGADWKAGEHALVGWADRARTLWRQDREAVARRLHDALPGLKANIYKPAALAEALAQWDALLAAKAVVGALPGERCRLMRQDSLRSGARKGVDPPRHAFFELAQEGLDLLEAWHERLERARLRLLRDLLDEAPGALREAKLQRRVVAFDDMLLNLHERLVRPEAGEALARAIRNRFPAALIDEFQDTDPLQWGIFDAVHRRGGCPLFLVGDPKQAIYGFRGADLPTYLAAREQADARHSLAENQRSTPALIAGLNALFSAVDPPFFQAGLDYTPVRAGVRPRPPLEDETDARAALQLWRLPARPDGEPLSKAEARERAAQATGAEIARLLSAARAGQVRLAERPLSGGDIAVLVRNHREGALMRRHLAAAGLGSVELSQASVHHSPEAEELERVLAAVLEPRHPGLLRAAMATRLLGFDAVQINALDDEAPAWLERQSNAAMDLETWIERGVGVMLRRWMQREGVAGRLLALPDGERRLTNLLHLFERLQEAAVAHPAPEALLRWLTAQREDDSTDEAAQLRLESDRHLVQIVTIHRSKGLEYPIVFCPFLWDGGRPPSSSGLGVAGHDASGQAIIDFRPGARESMRAAQAAAETGESLRLIYVALTRAVHRCIVVTGSYAVSRAGQSSVRESGKAPIHWLVTGGSRDPAAWLASGASAEEVFAGWSALAARAPEAVRCDPLPEAETPEPARPPENTADFVALPPPPYIAPALGLSSFSALVLGLSHEAAARDHDPADDLDETETRTGPQLDADDILRFPRGAEAGHCLHALLEQIDYRDDRGWTEASVDVLRQYPPAEAEDDRVLVPMLRRLLGDLLATDLAPALGPEVAPLRLSALPPERRLTEMEFFLPVAGLDTGRIVQTLHDAGLPIGILRDRELRGHLRGFIDLVFEHDGRYFVLDWKSNHLGHRAEDYAPPRLEDAMHRHGYHLQMMLYLVALHRHLRGTLSGYDIHRHLGGALYLFVRGVRPSWIDPQGRPAGVHAARPDPRWIETLSDLLDGRPGDAR